MTTQVAKADSASSTGDHDAPMWNEGIADATVWSLRIPTYVQHDVKGLFARNSRQSSETILQRPQGSNLNPLRAHPMRRSSNAKPS